MKQVKKLLNDAEKMKLSGEIARELGRYIDRKVEFAGNKESGLDLTSCSKDQLASTLWKKVVKGYMKYDPMKCPALPFLKQIVKKDFMGEAARLAARQDRRGEPTEVVSLEAPISDEENELTGHEVIGLDRTEAKRREKVTLVRKAMSRLPESEQRALEPIMYPGVTKSEIAKLLGISRPTLDRLITQAKHDFVMAWMVVE